MAQDAALYDLRRWKSQKVEDRKRPILCEYRKQRVQKNMTDLGLGENDRADDTGLDPGTDEDIKYIAEKIQGPIKLCTWQATDPENCTVSLRCGHITITQMHGPFLNFTTKVHIH